MDVRAYVDERGGVIGSPELSELLDVDPRETRAYAEENGIPMVGNAFVFSTEAAVAFAESLEQDETGEDEGEQEDEGDHEDEENDEDEGE
jgi:hypothetical protein